ncbi:MAG: imidazole glycerol phosphate synthase subunit HisF [Bacteroidetes bacterium]|jgi:cyclase|nr:imidazole glycerol phosphate synthase subunit HisF [Bacteroidota bacterium]
MLTRRIIPCLDVKNGRTVKGTQFVDLRDAGDPVELAAQYAEGGADELVLLDISATLEGRSTFLSLVTRVAEAVMVPFTVGGGIAAIDDILRALDAGADKVSLNSAILRDPSLLEVCARRVGSQSVVAAIDVRRSGASWNVWTRSGTTATARDAVTWARETVERGAGEILLTSMDRDGTNDGYDLDLLRSVSDAVSVPVIASGGAGNADHLAAALTQGRADAVLAASIFHYGRLTIAQVKHTLAEKGIPVRR